MLGSGAEEEKVLGRDSAGDENESTAETKKKPVIRFLAFLFLRNSAIH